MKIEALRTTSDADWPDADQDLVLITREGNLAGFRPGDRLICLCEHCSVHDITSSPPWWTVIGFGWTKEQLDGTQGSIRIDPTVLVLGTAWLMQTRCLQIVEHLVPDDLSLLRFISRERFVQGDRVWIPGLRYCGRVALATRTLTAEIRLGVEAATVQDQEGDVVRLVTDHPYGGPGIPHQNRTLSVGSLFPIALPPISDPWRATP